MVKGLLKPQSQCFNLPSTEDELRTEIALILEAISTHTQGEYEAFSRVFQNPRMISRIDDYGELSIGGVREYMVEYIGGLVSNAANTIGKLPQSLGWDQDKILEKIRER